MNLTCCLTRNPAGTPPVMLVHASDDTVASEDNSVVMYLALKRAAIPAELHLDAIGEHGFGVRQSSNAFSTWAARCVAWQRNQGVLKLHGGS